jgi:hypothetical protein
MHVYPDCQAMVWMFPGSHEGSVTSGLAYFLKFVIRD